MRKSFGMLKPTFAVATALLAWTMAGANAPGQTRNNSDSDRSGRAKSRDDDRDDDSDRDQHRSSKQSRRNRNEHAALGVTFYNEPNMLQIRRVMPDSPAEDAGLRRGDEILSINDQRVSTVQQVKQALDRAGEDEIVEIDILRNGRRRTIDTALAAQDEVFRQNRTRDGQQGQYRRSSRGGWQDQAQWSGQGRQPWQGQDYDDQDQDYGQQGYGNRAFSSRGGRGQMSQGQQRYREGYRGGGARLGVFLDQDNDEEGGVWITGVERGSPAEQAGLRRGDEIVSIDDEDVESNDDVMHLLSQMTPNEEVELRIERNGRARTVHVVLASRRQTSSQGQSYRNRNNRNSYGMADYDNDYGEQGYANQGYNSDYNAGAGNSRRGGAYYDNRSYGRRYQDQQDWGENY